MFYEITHFIIVIDCLVVSHWDDRNKINTIPRVWINSSKPSKNDR